MCTNALLCKENSLFRYGGTAGSWQNNNRRHFRCAKLTNNTLVHWHTDIQTYRHTDRQTDRQTRTRSKHYAEFYIKWFSCQITADKTDGYHIRVKVEVKVISFHDLPWRHRGDQRVWHYSSFNIGNRRGWVVNVMPRPLYPQELYGTNCIEGWVSPKAGLDGCGQTLPSPHSISGPSSP